MRSRLFALALLLLPAPALAYGSAKLSPDGKLLASVGDDGFFKLWDLSQKKEIASVQGVHGNNNQVRFTPDGKTVIALGDSNNIFRFDVMAIEAPAGRRPVVRLHKGAFAA